MVLNKEKFIEIEIEMYQSVKKTYHQRQTSLLQQLKSCVIDHNTYTCQMQLNDWDYIGKLESLLDSVESTMEK